VVRILAYFLRKSRFTRFIGFRQDEHDYPEKSCESCEAALREKLT
jgi:hypothetical protein